MTFEDELEVRRASVGAKVLGFAFAILAVLGSFWTVVWFIRSYVEQPRVTMAPTAAIATQEIVPAAPTVAPAPIGTLDAQPALPAQASAPAQAPVPAQPPAPIMADTPPPPPPAARVETPMPKAAPAPASADQRAANGSLSDRWAAIGPGSNGEPAAPVTSAPAAAGPRTAAVNPAPPPVSAAPAVAPMVAPPQAAPGPVATDSQIDEVEETAVPAIAGPAPLPRRKPTHVAAGQSHQPPLPRARPDGPAPQSIWTPVTPTDDRYQATQ
jgi:hypothetical protein